MRIGIADHLGWAVAVAVGPDRRVADRRRIELVEDGQPVAPIEHDAQGLSTAAATALVREARASSVRASTAALDELAASLPGDVASISLRAWPPDFPEDIDLQRRAPYNARADAVRYRQVLAEVAAGRGWEVHLYDARSVLVRAGELTRPPGPPWTKDHRVAAAAAILAFG